LQLVWQDVLIEPAMLVGCEASRLEELIDRFPRRKIAVIGDLILDEFVWGKVDRISPEAPVPVVQVTRESVRLGGAANVAVNLAEMGATPLVVGVIGGDQAGERFLAVLEKCGISSDGVVRKRDRTTTIKTRIVAHHQQVCRADREDRTALDSETTDYLIDLAIDRIEACDAVVLSDYAKGVLDNRALLRLIEYCGSVGRFVAVDPKRDDFRWYRHASIITPNKKEAERAAGFKISDDVSLTRAGREIMARAAVENLLITRGEEGMTLFRPEGQSDIRTAAREVFDVTGAGDTVIASFALAAGAGASVFEAALIANYAAGLVVGKLGTASASAQELLRSVRADIGD
jgi:D-beta-D-heptose 7-phosphate kinase/D-beta-D-heptose 1-phosphate adenosyltransferase